MRKIIQLFGMILLTFAVSLFISSCSSFGKNENSKSNKGSIIEDNQLKNENDNELENILFYVKNAINDDIWYKGDLSSLNSLQSKNLELDIYKKSKVDNQSEMGRIYILFRHEFEDGNNKVFRVYMMDSKDKGFANDITFFNQSPNLDELKSFIEKQGLESYKTANIEITKASQPHYPQLTPEREKIISNIEDLLKDSFISNSDYSYYIRNFRDNDTGTSVVVEDAMGQASIINVWITKDGKVGFGENFDISKVPIQAYRASQFKKVAIRTGNATIKSENVDTPRSDEVKVPDLESNSTYTINDYHPIVIRNLLLGGYKDKQWIKPADIKEKITGNEKYCLYSKDKLIGSVGGIKLTFSQASGALKINLLNDADYNKYFVGISAEWDLLPKKIHEVRDTTPYIKYINAILKEKNIEENPNIKASYKVDIDNDEIDEVFIEADNTRTLTESKKNQYSIIVMIKELQGEISATLIEDFINNSDSKNTLAYSHHIYGFADINGDGRLELIINSNYYEGGGYGIYEYINSKFELRLSSSDGL